VGLVSEAGELAAIAEAIARAPLVAFDLEFLSADRLVPRLCLIQIAWLDEHVALDAPPAAFVPQVRLVDPLAGDAAPVVAALAAHPVVVAHASRQDLGLLAQRFDARLPGLVDTQLMAAFSGVGDQIGLAALANELLGLQLGKEMQWTDWAARPLSDAQLAYARADVLHLPALYAKLAAKLGSRMPWVREESAQITVEALAAARVTPETAWQTIGALRGLDPIAAAAGIELAAWRQRTAIELDRPLGQVMTEKVIVELARQRPANPGAVRAVKGMSEHARRRADELVAVIGGARPGTAAPRTTSRGTSSRAARWGEMLLAIAHVIAEDTGIASRLLATRADAEEFARVFDERGAAGVAQLPALATWRREVLGTAWEGWLTGRVALIGDASAPHGVRLLPRS
jgi:ribonuclease D